MEGGHSVSVNSAERAAIQAFVLKAQEKYPGLQITSWPDDVSQANGEIDAIAETATLKMAIEHTSFDAVRDQRQDGVRFETIAKPLEQAFKGLLGATIEVQMCYRDVTPTFDWGQARELLHEWLNDATPALSDGTHDINLQGIPFPLRITKDSGACPQHHGVYFVRKLPEEIYVSLVDWIEKGLPVPQSMASHMGGQMANKGGKLGIYQRKGYRAVLVLESRDQALMNTDSAENGIQLLKDGGHLAGINEVWYVDLIRTGILGPEVIEITPD